MKQLLSKIGVKNLIDLIESGNLNIMYVEDFHAIMTQTHVLGNIHKPVVAHSPQHTFQIELEKICSELIKDKKQALHIQTRLLDLISVHKIKETFGPDIRELFLNSNYIKTNTRNLLNNMLPGYEIDNSYEIETEQHTDGLRLHVDLNFYNLNQKYFNYKPFKTPAITPNNILVKLLDCEYDLYWSSTLNSEIVTTPLNSNLVSSRISDIVKLDNNLKDMDAFSDLLFGHTKSVREAINAKQLPIEKAVKLVYRSSEFKKWLQNQPLKEELISEYYNNVTEGTFLSSTQGKVTRWAIFSTIGIGVGLALSTAPGLLTGLALTAVDTFLFEKLVSGWKPSQFIEEDVKGALNKITKS